MRNRGQLMRARVTQWGYGLIGRDRVSQGGGKPRPYIIVLRLWLSVYS